MNVPTWVWSLTIGVTTAVLLFDVFVIGRRPHEPSNKEVGAALAIYVGLALALRPRASGASPGRSSAPSSSPAG